eukprot:CAMPEP_0170748962 /NCGR_PEP_ID=MMETSP0437-20130122/10143_1 /TAXON_ID=0 /ORGANISM="Sexangularia sp." /LENGTH=437 /DNA_ID=CAMNT_0011087857 /DNA_START=43 /DNA_END=1356 /DNA_ORIENTATION=-
MPKFFGPPAAVDIGGSLAKIVYFRPASATVGGVLPEYVMRETQSARSIAALPFAPDPSLSMAVRSLGDLRFIKVHSSRATEFVRFVRRNGYHTALGSSLAMTGGGAYKYLDMIERELGVTVTKLDEMATAVRGLNFLLLEHDGGSEVYRYDWEKGARLPSTLAGVTNPFPYLLVIVGSGVSVVRVDSRDSFTRISGSSIGGGTFWGLCRMLTGIDDFAEVERLSKEGDNANVDLLVRDIYGGPYDAVGLAGDIIASSFGKAATAHGHVLRKGPGAPPAGPLRPTSARPTAQPTSRTTTTTTDATSLPGAAQHKRKRSDSPAPTAIPPSTSSSSTAPAFSTPDIIKSLLFMIANNIGQLAYLLATKGGAGDEEGGGKAGDLSTIIFAGGFVENDYLKERLSYAVSFWSQGAMSAQFAVHNAYLGALGAFLESARYDEG